MTRPTIIIPLAVSPTPCWTEERQLVSCRPTFGEILLEAEDFDRLNSSGRIREIREKACALFRDTGISRWRFVWKHGGSLIPEEW